MKLVLLVVEVPAFHPFRADDRHARRAVAVAGVVQYVAIARRGDVNPATVVLVAEIVADNDLPPDLDHDADAVAHRAAILDGDVGALSVVPEPGAFDVALEGASAEDEVVPVDLHPSGVP